MADHMRVYRTDSCSRQGLEGMINYRKSLLRYLCRKDFDSYAIVLSRLGLEEIYMKLVRLLRVTIGINKHDLFYETGRQTVSPKQ